MQELTLIDENQSFAGIANYISSIEMDMSSAHGDILTIADQVSLRAMPSAALQDDGDASLKELAISYFELDDNWGESADASINGQDEEIVVVGTRPSWWTGNPGGGGGGGGGGGSSGGEGGGLPPGPADLARTTGNTDCNATKEGFNDIIYALRSTKAGKQLLESTYGDTRLTFNFVTFSAGDSSTYNSYDRDRNVINVDPYIAGYGTNADGTTWSNSGIVALAHELAHYAYGPSEAKAIEIGNAIARELSVGAYHDSSTLNRQATSVSGQQRSTTSVTQTEFGIRPGCNDRG